MEAAAPPGNAPSSWAVLTSRRTVVTLPAWPNDVASLTLKSEVA